MFHLCLIICMWNLAMWRTSNPILNPSDSVAFSQIHIRRICSRVLHETSYIQSHSRPFPQTAVPLPRSSVPLPSRSRWCESRSREHIFLSGRIPALLCMPCITACVKQTPGRAWYLTRGTLCYQRSRGEMLSPAASQTYHTLWCDGRSSDRQLYDTADRHTSAWWGCVYCYTVYRHTRFGALMRWFTCSYQKRQRKKRAVNVDESISAGLPWDFIPLQRGTTATYTPVSAVTARFQEIIKIKCVCKLNNIVVFHRNLLQSKNFKN